MTIVLYAPCGEKKEHDVGIMLRNMLLSAFLSVEEPEKAVFRAKSGRPALALPSADISISHSRGIAAAALSFPGVMPLPVFSTGKLLCIDGGEKAFRIGLDIETVTDKKREQAEKIARREFSADEWTLLEDSQEDRAFLETFTAVWTRKESLVKNTGVGLAGIHTADTTALPAGFTLFTERIADFGTVFFLSAALKSLSDDEKIAFDDRADVPEEKGKTHC